MKILTVVGARPQFIKAAPVSKALREAGHHEFLVHTGQHYDHAMSQIFFDELGIPEPDVNLGVGSGSHGKQTGEMLMRLEEVIQEQKSDWVLVYGDTNSTLAGALAAVKLHMPVAHVEAGLRSFNREMPEEHNRVLTDHCADLLFCPTQTAANQLAREGILKGVHCVGDTMVDAILQFSSTAAQRSDILDRYGLSPKRYALATIHRPYNTDVAEQLSGILAAFGDLDDIVVFPAHPRTAKRIFELRINLPDNVRLLEPIGYLDMLWLEQNSRLIMTDSGGIQKEAFVFGVPCITLRTETEWMETVESGWNVLAHTDPQRIVELAKHTQWPVPPPKPVFGRGHAAVDVVRILASAEM